MPRKKGTAVAVQWGRENTKRGTLARWGERDEPRNKSYSVYLTQSEADKIREAARAVGLSQADFLIAAAAAYCQTRQNGQEDGKDRKEA